MDGIAYVVQAGDSLLSIAQRYGVTVEDIVRGNGLANPDFVFSGQRLIIPGATGLVAETVTPSASGPVIAAVENAGELAREAILIVNESNDPVNLLGWRLERENGPGYTFGPVQLFAGSSVRVFSAAGENTTIALYWNQGEPIWGSGATARLINADGTVVDSRSEQ